MAQRSPSVASLVIGRTALLGAGWVREEFTASRLHSSPAGPYRWWWYDRVINAERRAGLHILGLLDYSNTWRFGNHAMMPHGDISSLSQDFAGYAYAVVRHFRGRVEYWQVWNEPDLTLFWRPWPNPGDYAQLLRSADRAIKRADPRARVVLAGTSGVDLGFIRQVVDRTRSFDVLSVHPYRPVPEWGLLDQMAALRRFRKPIWFSEVGWAAGDCELCLTETTQARYLARFYALAAAAGAEHIFWYDLRDDDSAFESPEAHFGLLRRDLSAKPAFAAYRTLARLLQGSTFQAAPSLGADGLYVLRFQTRRGPVVVAWNLGRADRAVSASWAGPSVQLVSMMGAPLGTTERRGGQATFTVPADGEPLYLVSQSPGDFSLPGPLLHFRPPRAAHPPRRVPARRHSDTGRAAWRAHAPGPRHPARHRRVREHGVKVPRAATPTPTLTPTPTPSGDSSVKIPTPDATPGATDVTARDHALPAAGASSSPPASP